MPSGGPKAENMYAAQVVWDETMAVNLTAAWVLSQSLLPILRQRKGTIVNVG